MTTDQGQKSRGTAIVAPLLVVLGAAALFAVAFLITHHGAAKAPPAKIVDARIKPGPNASELRTKLDAKIGPLVKPVVKKKPKKQKVVTTPAVSSAASAPVVAAPATPVAPAPAAVPSAPSSSTHSSSGSGKKKPPSGGGVITVG